MNCIFCHHIDKEEEIGGGKRPKFQSLIKSVPSFLSFSEEGQSSFSVVNENNEIQKSILNCEECQKILLKLNFLKIKMEELEKEKKWVEGNLWDIVRKSKNTQSFTPIQIPLQNVKINKQLRNVILYELGIRDQPEPQYINPETYSNSNKKKTITKKKDPLALVTVKIENDEEEDDMTNFESEVMDVSTFEDFNDDHNNNDAFDVQDYPKSSISASTPLKPAPKIINVQNDPNKPQIQIKNVQSLSKSIQPKPQPKMPMPIIIHGQTATPPRRSFTLPNIITRNFPTTKETLAIPLPAIIIQDDDQNDQNIKNIKKVQIGQKFYYENFTRRHTPINCVMCDGGPCVKKVVQSKFLCKDCKIDCFNEKDLNSHLISEEHKKKKEENDELDAILKEKRQKLIDKKTQWYCELCKMVFKYQKLLQRHLNGARHRVKLREAEESSDEDDSDENGDVNNTGNNQNQNTEKELNAENSSAVEDDHAGALEDFDAADDEFNSFFNEDNNQAEIKPERKANLSFDYARGSKREGKEIKIEGKKFKLLINY